jgi:hypothetical protein
MNARTGKEKSGLVPAGVVARVLRPGVGRGGRAPATATNVASPS